MNIIETCTNDIQMSKCYKCFRPIKNCYCKYIKPIKTDIKFIFLIHPKEAYKQKIGTGRLAHLSMFDSNLIIGVDFSDNLIVNKYINDTLYHCVVLYPGSDSLTVSSEIFKQNISLKKLLVFIIDATWTLAKKMLRLSVNLQKLPAITFNNKYVSKFIIKSQPESFYLSTIESVFYLIKEMQNEDMIKRSINPDGLMEIFQKMIDFQILCKNDPEKESYRSKNKD